MQFTLTSDEGLPIRGNLTVPADAEALVILIHGFKGFKDWGFFPWLTNALVEQQIAVCRFNMSRSGIGEDLETFDRLDLFADDTYTTQLADLRVVIGHAQSRVALPTFLLGHSRGGGVALLGAAEAQNLHGVITWNAIAHTDRWDDATKATWRRQGYFDVENARTKQMMRMSTRALDDLATNDYDILRAASRLDVPLLAIHGGRDETIPGAESIELAKSAREAVRLMISTASHTLNAVHPLVSVPRELALAAAVTARFVAAYSDV